MKKNCAEDNSSKVINALNIISVHNNAYSDKYIQLIKCALYRDIPIDRTIEYHHVLPRCVYGQNKIVVPLTSEEHYTAHMLLWKMFPDQGRLAMAAYLMSNRFQIKSSIEYEQLREEATKAQSQKAKNNWANKDFREKRIRAFNTLEHKKLRSELAKTRWKEDAKYKNHMRDYFSAPSTIEHRKTLSILQWGNPEHKLAMSKTRKERWKDPEYREMMITARKR